MPLGSAVHNLHALAMQLVQEGCAECLSPFKLDAQHSQCFPAHAQGAHTHSKIIHSRSQSRHSNQGKGTCNQHRTVLCSAVLCTPGKPLNKHSLQSWAIDFDERNLSLNVDGIKAMDFLKLRDCCCVSLNGDLLCRPPNLVDVLLLLTALLFGGQLCTPAAASAAAVQLWRRAAWEGLLGLTSALHLLHSSTQSPTLCLNYCFKHCHPLLRLA